jgi:hypothetical protein
MTLEEIRLIAVALPEVEEKPHFDFTSFRVKNKIFVTAPPTGAHVHIFLQDDDREIVLGSGADFVEALPWGKKIVGVRVALATADPAAVEDMILAAWRSKAPKRLV